MPTHNGRHSDSGLRLLLSVSLLKLLPLMGAAVAPG